MKVLITGGSGFIGHHLAQTLFGLQAEITFLERLSHSGNLNRIHEITIPGDKYRIVHHDLRSPISPQLAKQIGDQDYIFHLAALTHVDRAIADPLGAVMDNVVGTTNVLNFARTLENLGKFFYFSTDEVFGPAPPGKLYKEWDRYRSTNPYAAAKAGGEEMALAFQNTYDLPVVITHTMNVFGERQHPEKFIPSTIRKVSNHELVTVHADRTRTIPGSRFYIHAASVAGAMVFLMKWGKIGEKYNIVGEKEVDNLSLAKLIAKIQGKDLRAELVDFHSSRPGHDLRYGLDGSLMASLGWEPQKSLEGALEQTVNWTLANPRWL